MVEIFENATLLLGIGAPRTGTKWLSNYFAQHSQILMSPLRVLHHFDTFYAPGENARYRKQFEQRLNQHLAKTSGGRRKADHADSTLVALKDRVRMTTDENAYLEYFRNQWSGEKVFCDVTPAYATLPREVFERMNKAHSRVKFLFGMRNPIDRLWSGLRLHKVRDAEADPYVEIDRRLQGGRGVWKDYCETIENLDATVPPDAVRFIFFENFFNQDAIDDLCDFLDVDREPAAVDQPMNQTQSLELDLDRRGQAYRKFEQTYQFVYNRFGGKLPASWLDDMSRFSSS